MSCQKSHLATWRAAFPSAGPARIAAVRRQTDESPGGESWIAVPADRPPSPWWPCCTLQPASASSISRSLGWSFCLQNTVGGNKPENHIRTEKNNSLFQSIKILVRFSTLFSPQFGEIKRQNKGAETFITFYDTLGGVVGTCPPRHVLIFNFRQAASRANIFANKITTGWMVCWDRTNEVDLPRRRRWGCKFSDGLEASDFGVVCKLCDI